MRKLSEVIERKKQGIDCTPIECERLRDFIKERVDSINSWDMKTFEDIRKYFPEQYGRASAEHEAEARAHDLKIKVAIVIRSGNVVSVKSNSSELEYVVVDYDNIDGGFGFTPEIQTPDCVSGSIYEMFDTKAVLDQYNKLKKLNF